MSFFNQKEDVLDIELTQYGKNLLSRGHFKPVYYRFFDDDILYDSTKGGFSEAQNEAEIRILKETPKIKTQHLTTSPSSANQTDNMVENLMHNHGFRGPILGGKEVDYNVQEKILLYPVCDQEIGNKSAPSFDVLSLDSKFAGPSSPITYQHFTSSGIIKNIPQFDITSEFLLVRDSRFKGPARMINNETFFDLTSNKITFADNTNLHLSRSAVVLDIEEQNTYYGKNNFLLEIYETHKNEETGIERLKKIKTTEDIRNLFHIKTDSSITFNGAKYKTKKQRNSQNRRTT